jgi:hypothetical protein
MAVVPPTAQYPRGPNGARARLSLGGQQKRGLLFDWINHFLKIH